MAQNKIVRREENRQLKVTLTQDEILQAGQKMADAQQLIVELDAEAQSFKDTQKGKVAQAEAELSRNSALVRQKYDFRRVACEIMVNHTTQRVNVYRMDLDELIEDRPMTKDELSALPI
jgi:hypothetical protein